MWSFTLIAKDLIPLYVGSVVKKRRHRNIGILEWNGFVLSVMRILTENMVGIMCLLDGELFAHPIPSISALIPPCASTG